MTRFQQMNEANPYKEPQYDSEHIVWNQGATWADKNILQMVQTFIQKNQMLSSNSNHSDAFMDGYNNALVQMRDFLAYQLNHSCQK